MLMRHIKEFMHGVESRWQIAGWLLLLAFPVTALVVNKAASTIFTLFAFAGLWLLIKGKHERPERELRWVMLAFAAYFFVGLASYLLGEQNELGRRILGRDIRFLVSVLCVIALLRGRTSLELVSNGLGVGGIFTGIFAVVEYVLADRAGYRASGESISILFGSLAAGLYVINVSIACFSRSYASWLNAFAAVGSLLAVVLSGTRGALTAAILISTVIAIRWTWAGTGRKLYAGIGVLSVMAALVLANLAGLKILERFELAAREISVTFENHDDAFPNVEHQTGCLNEKAFLVRLVDNLRVGRPELADISVQNENGAKQFGKINCPSTYYIRFEHPGKKKRSSWAWMPHRSVPADSLGGTLLVRGKGRIELWRPDRTARVDIDQETWTTVSPPAEGVRDSRFLLVPAKGKYLDVIPYATRPGEYRFIEVFNSVAMRIAMWGAAAQVFLEHPVFGAGPGNFQQLTREHASAADAPWQISEFDHPHNEILTVAAERGIIGLLSLFAVYAAPFWLFLRRRDVFGYAGMAFVASIFLSGLTETIFNHSLGITYYSMMVLILATAPRADAGGMTENTQTSRKS